MVWLKLNVVWFILNLLRPTFSPCYTTDRNRDEETTRQEKQTKSWGNHNLDECVGTRRDTRLNKYTPPSHFFIRQLSFVSVTLRDISLRNLCQEKEESHKIMAKSSLSWRYIMWIISAFIGEAQKHTHSRLVNYRRLNWYQSCIN